MAKEIVAWDSCIIIDAIQQETNRYPSIFPMIRKAEAGDLLIVISMASISEVLYLRELTAKGLSEEEQNNLIEKWFDSSYIVKRAVDFGVGKKAAELRRQFQTLTPVDSMILATAVLVEADVLVTYDDGGSGDSIGLLELNGKIGASAPKIR